MQGKDPISHASLPSPTCGVLLIANFEQVKHIDCFNNFLTRAAELTGNVAATLVLNNAPCHRRERNANIGNNAIRFLPAYSPMLTIAENVWSA